jgi:thiosulfate/3-mercaptopyruvate sulfurtransferase
MLFAAVPAASRGELSRPAHRALPPLVSTNWLVSHGAEPRLVILDVRSDELYATGHIPGAVSSPSSNWVVMGDLLLELPELEDLFAAIGSAGITKRSRVVVVGSADTPFALADTTRVVITLLYGGIRSVAVLDGGHDKWVREGKPLSTEPAQPKTVVYSSSVNQHLFIVKEQVEARIGKSILIDARTPDVFFGVTQEPWTVKAGHIPTAICLPAPWMWNEDGTYKDTTTLKAMALGITGQPAYPDGEIIVYCGVGGYGATLLFVLHEILGYRHVKLYDGSAQEWTSDPELPVVQYRW